MRMQCQYDVKGSFLNLLQGPPAISRPGDCLEEVALFAEIFLTAQVQLSLEVRPVRIMT